MPENSDREAFETHLNYISCLCRLIKGKTLIYTGALNKVNLPDIDKKKNLIALTEKSLKDEYDIVRIDEDYSYASTSWLPIKSYYLIFNVLLTIEYIFKTQKSAFDLGHPQCIDEFSRKLKSGQIQFSEPLLNQVFDQSILSHTVQSGANLSFGTSDSDMCKMAFRKIAKYKAEAWKRKKHIDPRKRAHRDEYRTYLQSFMVSVFDFPYQMRIRSNYRDFAFIDNVSTSETAHYFRQYYSFTVYLVRALKGLKSELVDRRT